jgi:hypothetical protein
MIGLGAPFVHAAGDDGLDDADQVQNQRNQQQAGLKVFADGGNDEGEDDEDQPGEEPDRLNRPPEGERNSDAVPCPTEQQQRATPSRTGDV